MKKTIVLFVLGLSFSFKLFAQTDPATSVVTGPMGGGPLGGPMVGAMPLFAGQGLDFSFGGKQGIGNIGTSFSWWHSFYSFSRFAVSGGYRWNQTLFDNANFTAKSKSGSYPDEIFVSGNGTSVNIMVSGEMEPIAGLGFGFNIDLLGVSYGKLDVVGQKFGSTTETFPKGTLEANMPLGNLLVGPNLDFGNLNSEFYLYFFKAPFMQVRVGLSHLYSSVLIGDDEKVYNSYFSIPFMAFRGTF